MLSEAPKSVVFRNGGFTDGNVYFVPSGDGITGHGKCYDLSGDEAQTTDASACVAGADAAKQDLSMSDRVIENDLIAVFREEDE